MSEQRDIEPGIARRSFLKQLTVLGVGAGVLGACARTAAGGGAMGGAAGAAGAAAAAGAPGAAAGGPGVDDIGLQLYTVRDQLQRDFEGTIERVAAIGYRRLEFAGYYERTPEQVRALLDRLRLSAPSSHVGVPLLRRDLAGQLAMAQTIGHSYITAPSYPLPRDGTPVEWTRIADEFNAWGGACRAQGLRFAFHNHAAEFQPAAGGPTGMDVLLRETDPSLVDFELDLYWARHAGQDPLDLFRRYPGRFTMWHVKDMTDPQGTKAMAPVGQGTTDFAALFAQASTAGLRHFFVEHDNAAQTTGSLQSIEASYGYLRRLLA